ncbi:MAG: tetratricopeptide repeat protein [Hyphomicrobiaceae bacterium]
MAQRLIATVLLMVVASLCRLEAAPGADTSVANAKEAAVALQRGRPDEAVRLYSIALDDPGLSNDRRAGLLNDRGVANARLNKLREAIDDFNNSIRLAPEGASAYNNRGNVLLALGYSVEAEKDFDRAIVLAPGYTAAYVNRGSARALTGETENALKDFSHAIRLAPKSPAAYGGRGRLHLAANRPYAAVRDFNRAVGNDPRYAPGYRLRAEAQVILGRFDAAIEDLSRAIAFDGANAELYQARGYAYLAARNPASAIKDFQRSSELKPRTAAPLEGLALAQARVGAHDEALDTLSRALEADPRSAQAFAYRAIVYKLMGQVELGVKDLDRAVKLSPDQPEVHWARGEILEAEGRKDEAIAELRTALGGRPHLRDAAAALERLGAPEPRDAEVAELAFERWRVFVNKGRYYTTNADYPRLNVPLETMREGSAPRILEFEKKGGAQAGIGILRFAAGLVETAAGATEQVEHGAVLDLEAQTVLAVETMRQGEHRATWTWEDDKLVVTGLDGFKQEYDFKAPKAREEVAARAAPSAALKTRPRPRRDQEQAWNPWGDGWPGSGGGQRPRRQQQPKSFFQLLFGN